MQFSNDRAGFRGRQCSFQETWVRGMAKGQEITRSFKAAGDN